MLPPETGDPLAAPHTYVSDFQDDVDVEVFTDYVEMLDRAPVDAVNDFTTLALHHQIAEDVVCSRQASADAEAAGDIGGRGAAHGGHGRGTRA